MLRTVAWTLRQRRYAAMAALLFVVAVGCVAAGTWQIARFQQSVHANNALRSNAHAPAVPLTTRLVPLTAHGPVPGEEAVRFRTVTAVGHYAPGAQQYLSTQWSGGERGYAVVTPFRTASGVLLVERGFVAPRSDGRPPELAPPPAGQLRVTGRLQSVDAVPPPVEHSAGGVITSIDPTGQAARLGAPVYQTYLTLDPHQPGTAGLRVLPAPDLSNPAGGAYEWQHFAYIIQWYLFALLALVAPFAIARHEVREARRQFLGSEEPEFDLDEDEIDPQLEGGPARPEVAGEVSAGSLAVRSPGTVARADDVAPERLRRAARLADRYGRAISMGGDDAASAPARARDHMAAPFRRRRGLGEVHSGRRSADAPHRSDDTYHGAYNDYLWQLALADGAIPADEDADEQQPEATPRVIDAPAQPRELPADDD